jgi:hypothetical protein
LVLSAGLGTYYPQIWGHACTFQLQKSCDSALQNIYRLRVSENRVLRGIIKTNKKELTVGSTKPHISISCTSISDITQVLESRKMR